MWSGARPHHPRMRGSSRDPLPQTGGYRGNLFCPSGDVRVENRNAETRLNYQWDENTRFTLRLESYEGAIWTRPP